MTGVSANTPTAGNKSDPMRDVGHFTKKLRQHLKDLLFRLFRLQSFFF